MLAPAAVADLVLVRRNEVHIVRRNTRWITLLFVVVVCAGTEMPAVTQQYPTKPVLVIEPFGTGGGPDLLARTLAQQLSKLWGQPVTVENVPGAGATAGPAQVAKSPPDGYTLLLTTSAQAYSAVFSKSLPYDPLKDFIPIVPLSSQPYVLVAGNSAGITTVGELIAAAKAKPGQLKFGSTGVGTGTHLGLRNSISRLVLGRCTLPADQPMQSLM
jgi:Uncharacterized protein conserved in bacteria